MPSRSKKSRYKFLKSSEFRLGAAASVIVLVAGFAAGVNYEKDEPTYLFMQQAVTGSLRPVATESGTYTLTLIGVKPHTLMLTDLPKRTVGSWTNTDFVMRWNQSKPEIALDAPDAVLLSHSPVDGKEYSVAVELSNPVFDGPGGWLTYSVKLLKKTGEPNLVISGDRHMEAFPEILRSPALFIDGFGKWGGERL